MNLITRKDVVSIIADIIEPHKARKIARNNIRGHITRAIVKGELVPRNNDNSKFEHDHFWQWAVEHWPELRNHPQIPRMPYFATLSKTIEFSVNATGFDVPSNDELPEKYRAAQEEIIRLRQECEKKDAEIHKLRFPGRPRKKR